jgi:hypothetical protein
VSLSLAGNGTIIGFDAVASGFGGLVEVKTVVKTDTQTSSLAPGGSVAVSGLTISHSVADAAHKVILFGMISGSQDSIHAMAAALTAAGSVLSVGDAAGNRTLVQAQNTAGVNTRASTVTLIAAHTPGSTASVTYGADVYNAGNVTTNVFVNRTTSDADQVNIVRSTSFLLLAEVKV